MQKGFFVFLKITPDCKLGIHFTKNDKFSVEQNFLKYLDFLETSLGIIVS